jgi:hypothetical protein
MRAVFAGRHDVALCMLLAVTLVALFHGAALGFELVWDDLAWINDFHRHTLASLLKDNFTANTLVSYYRPLVAASLNLQLALSHSPVFLHAFNLALHALNLCLLILIASPAMARGGLRQPLAVTVLAVHPVLVEPVVWVSGRFDLMFTSFVLLGLLAALRVRSTTRRGLAVALSFLAALCCKESALAYAAVGPVLVAVIGRARQGGTWRDTGRAALEHGLALAAGLAIYLALRVAVLELPLVRDTAFQVQGTPQPGAHALLVLRTFGTYLQMSVLPLWNLAPLHALGDEPNAFSGYAAAGAGVLLLALGGLRWPACLPFTVWTLALLPAANLVPFRLDLVQCRYLYFPLFAATLCALHLPAARPRAAARPAPRACAAGHVAGGVGGHQSQHRAPVAGRRGAVLMGGVHASRIALRARKPGAGPARGGDESRSGRHRASHRAGRAQLSRLAAVGARESR